MIRPLAGLAAVLPAAAVFDGTWIVRAEIPTSGTAMIGYLAAR